MSGSREPSFLPLRLDGSVDLEVESVRVVDWVAERMLDGGTVFGLVTEPTEVELSGGPRVALQAGSWFVAPGGARVRGGRGLAIVVPGYRGLMQLGGPIEPTGRLRYIDGCTDTLLVCPPRLGEPCLNHLHLPAGTDQSAHTHPSARIGVIARGAGWCRTGDHRFELTPGLGWVIPTGCRHAFATDGEPLDVLAWHPDSDFGPTDRDHPMINRTFVG